MGSTAMTSSPLSKYNSRLPKDLRERAAPGLHTFCEQALVQRIRRNAKLLDIAAGTGAFCQRLLAAGYTDVTANEIDRDAFGSNDVPLLSLNLNTGFSKLIGNSWDVIIAMEVIEHLENPFQFIRELYSSLKPGGVLLLTTPNVTNAQSRSIFLRRGYFNNVSPHPMPAGSADPGHITILPDWLIDCFFKTAGFVDIETYYPKTTGPTRASGVRSVLGGIVDKLIQTLFMSHEPDKAKGHWVVLLATKSV